MLLLGEHAIIIQPNGLEQDSKTMIFGCRRWCGSQRMAPETTLRLYRGAADRLRCHILPIGEESWVYWGKEYDYTRFIEQNRRAADVVFAVIR